MEGGLVALEALERANAPSNEPPPETLVVHVLYSESVEAKTTLVLRDSKSAARSLKAMISVGHTKVQAMGTKPRTSHCFVDVYWVRLRSVHTLVSFSLRRIPECDKSSC